MKVATAEIFRVDGGGRIFCYLKLTSDDGIVGWSEFQEAWGAPGLGSVIEALASQVVGEDPHRIEAITSRLKTATVQARGGLARQAIGAYENALLDLKGKSLGVPVSQLLGGAIRDRIPVYWSHCGSYRAGQRALTWGLPPVRTYEDLEKLGGEVVDKGFKALKTNVLMVQDGQLSSVRSGGRREGQPELNWNPGLARAAHDTVMAFRSAVGPDISIMLDLHFSLKTEGYVRLAAAIEPAALSWLEVDTHDPGSLAYVRRRANCPVASLEAVYERHDFRPYLDAYAVDVALVDVMFNGYLESLKIASLADVYEVNVTPHNFYSHFSSYIAAHFSASVPNLRIMEIDIDGAPLRDELVGGPPPVEHGEFVLPTTPGWGVEVDEAVLRRRAVKG